MFDILKKDLHQTYCALSGGKAKKILNTLRQPGVQATITFRFGNWLYRKGGLISKLLFVFYLYLNYRTIVKWGICIPRQTQIGPGLYIGHFGGIILNGDCILGDNVSISQGVTIGVSGKKEKKGCPTIGDNVYIGPGAKVHGKITIGEFCKIGANAVVAKDMPPHSTCYIACQIDRVTIDTKR